MISNKKHVKAFLPGTIINLLVKEGQAVKEGDILAILEAMKMNNRIVAPVSGTVKSVNTKVGDRVTKNMVMIELE